jgi:hypothetical protein
MSGPWHKREPTLLQQLKQELERGYQDLGVLADGDCVYLRGSFPIIHQEIELDRFQIEVKIPQDFPKNIPLVKDLGGRVPLNNPDWHTYDSGFLCVIVPEEWLITPQSGSVVAFLDGPVRNFFIAHALAEAGIKRPMGERPHFVAGLWEAYGEMVGSNEPSVIQRYLRCLSREQTRGHWDCPCGSGKKLRNCHVFEVAKLQKKIPPHVAKSALKRLHTHTKGQHGAILK